MFNLTVDDMHEYVANGVGLANCDALRYALMARAPRKRRPPEPGNRGPDYDDYLDEIVRLHDRGGKHPVLGRMTT